MILRHKKLEKQICSCFCASLWFRVSHVTPSLHAASGNAFKSSKPGKRAAFMLVEHTVCFGQLPNLLPSLLCVTLCGPSLSLPHCSLWNIQNRKAPFCDSGCCVAGWPPPTASALHERSDGRKNICFISIPVDKPKQRHCSISFTCPRAPCGWDPQPVPRCRWPLK